MASRIQTQQGQPQQLLFDVLRERRRRLLLDLTTTTVSLLLDLERDLDFTVTGDHCEVSPGDVSTRFDLVRGLVSRVAGVHVVVSCPPARPHVSKSRVVARGLNVLQPAVDGVLLDLDRARFALWNLSKSSFVRVELLVEGVLPVDDLLVDLDLEGFTVLARQSFVTLQVWVFLVGSVSALPESFCSVALEERRRLAELLARVRF